MYRYCTYHMAKYAEFNKDVCFVHCLYNMYSMRKIYKLCSKHRMLSM